MSLLSPFPGSVFQLFKDIVQENVQFTMANIIYSNGRFQCSFYNLYHFGSVCRIHLNLDSFSRVQYKVEHECIYTPDWRKESVFSKAVVLEDRL